MANATRGEDEHRQEEVDDAKRREQVAKELDEGVRKSLQALITGLDSLEPCLRDDESAQRILKGLSTIVGAIIDDVERLASDLHPRVPRLFSMVFDDRVMPLKPGTYVIGRAEDCEIQFDRQRASRKHAEITIGLYEAHIEDLGSTNGVYVNGRRIASRQRLRTRDVVAIGDEHFELRSDPQGSNPLQELGRCELPTLREDAPATPLASMRDETEETDMLGIVGAMAIKWLDQDRVPDAEHALSGHLRQIISRARAAPVRRSTATSAVDYALRLALATSKADWISYILELSTLCKLELSVPAVVALERLHGSGVQLPIEALKAYLEKMGKAEGASREQGYALVRLRRLALGARNARGSGARP
jgi:FHA domain